MGTGDAAMDRDVDVVAVLYWHWHLEWLFVYFALSCFRFIVWCERRTKLLLIRSSQDNNEKKSNEKNSVELSLPGFGTRFL